MGFKIGDIVMRMDGDKRPHKIMNITVHHPLNNNEHTFFQYHYEDGGSDISDGHYLKPYDGKYKKNTIKENIITLNGIDYIEILAKTNDKICKDCEYFLDNRKCIQMPM